MPLEQSTLPYRPSVAKRNVIGIHPDIRREEQSSRQRVASGFVKYVIKGHGLDHISQSVKKVRSL
jgi:hypothetical protein